VYVVGKGVEGAVTSGKGEIYQLNKQNDTFIGKYIGYAYNKELFGVCKDTNDNIYVTGISTNPISGGDTDILILKYDSNLNLIKAATYGDSLRNYGWKIKQLSNGNLAVCGYIYDTSTYKYKGILLVTDTDLNIIKDIIFNYDSNDYLNPIGFNWSEECKDVKIKEYKFEDGVFYLSIMFDEIIYYPLNLGTITFSPIKKGETNLNVSGKVSSEWGIQYDGSDEYYLNYGEKSQYTEPYPETKFYGSTVTIKGAGNYTGSTSLSGELNENTISSVSATSTIINNVNVITNRSSPEIIIKEINISEEKPDITIIINTDEKNSLNYTLLMSIFIGSIFSGAVFGLVFRRMIP
jgi:hypothetical protein